ncbi:MAG: hypothetical protein ACREPP_12060 [Rhodanobacteraceae bacterium]
MELDEMKLAWQTLGAQLERQHALNVQFFRESRLDKLRRGLRPLMWGQWLQLVIGVALAICGAVLWTTHLQRVDVLACGLVANAYGVLLIAFAARNLYLIHCIDHAAPVLDIQRKIAGLRAFRVRVEAPVNAVVCCFLWIPVLWANMALYGINLWSPGFIRWAVASGFAGLISITVVVWAMRRMGHARKIEDNSAGRSVVRAQAALDEIARFERE